MYRSQGKKLFLVTLKLGPNDDDKITIKRIIQIIITTNTISIRNVFENCE